MCCFSLRTPFFTCGIHFSLNHIAQFSQRVAASGVGVQGLVREPLFPIAAPLAVLFLGMGTVMRRASAAGAQLFFFIFATLIGLSLSSIFIRYTGHSITQTFLVTAIAFAGLSLYGYTTKKDISGWGSFLIMGVIGLVVAMIVNIFLQSPALLFAISAIGVLVFAGLTAYDTQNIKNEYLAHAHHGDQEWLAKSAIFGALNLYLDFLNMFQFLLMFMGNNE